MAIKRHPKRNNIIGVHWTQWPWPSMVARAIYRRYGPRIGSAETNQMMSNRLSIAYFFSAVALCGMMAISYSYSEMRNDGEHTWAKYWLKDQDVKDKKIMHYKISGFTVTSSEDITEKAREKVRERNQ